mmetsp:Transcript_52474/g.151186  ORF Transcript_52474/g.151186 Transcript_52474/m.151186 type:complete len:308 (+) Transcript_52474:156-1079(+)
MPHHGPEIQVPHVDRHVVGCGHQLIVAMRVGLDPSHSELVPVQNLHRSGQLSKVKHADGLVDAAGDNHPIVVLVPIDRQDLVLMRLDALHGSVPDGHVLDVQHRITAHGGQAHGPGWRPNCSIGDLLVRHERPHADPLHHVPNAHGVVPSSRRDQVLRVEIPVDAIHLRGVALEGHDRPMRLAPIEQLDRAVALGGGEHMLVGLAPSAVVDPILREPVGYGSRLTTWRPDVEDMQAAVAHDAVVLRSAHGEEVPVEGRKLDAVAREGRRQPCHEDKDGNGASSRATSGHRRPSALRCHYASSEINHT